ncbi:conserved protein of unknown function [Aldo/keto reductase domain] [Magnetospira sp. QH-2]|nr:conserved protein of unknown function [Aldo/keto reductase domain] [Magnetospira sp. QH-2]
MGQTGIAVSEIGFGAWGIGGKTEGATSYGATDDPTSLAALDRAMDLGINFFDTASLYGDGHSEALIGQATQGRRDHLVIASKAGWDRFGGAPDLSPKALRRSLSDSLGRLRTDYLDLLMLHNPPVDDVARMAMAVKALKALQGDGVIRSWGLSTKTPAEALRAITELQVPVVQVNLNLLDLRAVDGGLLAAAKRQGVGVIARTPLNFGFLSGAVGADTVFEDGDHRRAWTRSRLSAWEQSSKALFEAFDLRDVADRVAFSLRFCLSFDAVAAAIPGILTPAEAEMNALAQGALPAPVLERALEIARANDPFAR